MGITFLHPWALLLAVPAGGLVILLALRSRSGLDPYRLWLTTGIRLAVVLALVAALAQVQFVREKDDLAVAFLLDCSQSVPAAERQKALDRINDTCRKMGEKDRAALIPFGAEPAMETTFKGRLEVGAIGSVLKGDQTDIAGALRLASAAFPPGTQRRAVLISDGNENAGNALEEASQLRASGIALDVLPVSYAYDNEVMMESLLVPGELNRDEAMEAKLVVFSSKPTQATVSFYQNHQLVARQEGVQLKQGKNVLSIPRRLSGDKDQPNRAGFYAFEAYVEAPGDRLPENNRAHAFSIVRGDAKVLLIEDQEHADRWLLDALVQEGFAVDRCTPDHLPGGMAEIQSYDAVILSNIAADQLPQDVVEGIPSAVRDLGMGLIMIGGDNSFGAGGWYQTGIEEVLPVSMDLTQRKVVPNGALAIILHTMEIPDGVAWAKEIAVAALDALSPQDYFGELQMGMGGEEWGIKLQKAENKGGLKALIRGLNNQDMHDYNRVFQMAYDGLKPLKASIKHCVFISDGDPGPPTKALLDKMVKDKITVSTVCTTSIHGGQGMACLKWIADNGGGKFYNVPDPKHLPKIFAKEAQVVRRSLICFDTFLPKARYQTDLLRGVQGLPPLHGYVCTTPKEKAELPIVSHQGDPILAHWRIGLGKSVAFTSDARNAWGSDWISWGDYKRFWSQVLRWALRSAPKSNFQVQTEIREGRGRVMVDALDSEGRFVNDLSFDGRVSDPSHAGQGLAFSQTGPGRYEATFEAKDAGAYYVSFGYKGEKGEQGLITTGAAVSYSPEFKDLKTNQALLTRLAETGKGKVLSGLEGVFAHDLPKPRASTDLWPWMLQIVAWGFFADIILRRVLIGRRELAAGGKRVLALLPAVGGRFRTKAPTREETLASLLSKKAAVQQEEVRRFEAGAADLAAGEQLTTDEAAKKPQGLGEGLKPSGPALPPTPTLGQAGPAAPQSYTERLLEAKRKAMEEERRKRGEGK